MPTGDADWLASTAEPTLEPEIPICDAHHHLWDFRPEPVPYQRYLLAELAEDLGSGHNVRATVFIEVKARYRPDGPEDMRPVGEVEFVEGLATESARGRYGHTRMAAAIIGYADLWAALMSVLGRTHTHYLARTEASGVVGHEHVFSRRATQILQTPTWTPWRAHSGGDNQLTALSRRRHRAPTSSRARSCSRSAHHRPWARRRPGAILGDADACVPAR